MAKSRFWQNKPPRSFVLFTIGMLGLAIVLGVLFIAPNLSWRQSGSTYNRSPDGYGAWYSYMTEQQGIALERWRQPLSELPQDKASPKTLLQIQPKLVDEKLDRSAQQWVANGNTLIILGVRQPATKAPYSRQLSSPAGNVKIETARRSSQVAPPKLLADDYGAVVWQPQKRVIYVTTANLAANAYQDVPGNFRLLEQLVTQTKQPIVVDEFLHGYGDRTRKSGKWGWNSGKGEGRFEDNIFSYFARTPLVPLLVQAMILLLIAILAKNRRFGRWQSIVPPTLDNSEAYIQALSGALRQANSRAFVMETVNKAELQALQRRMGLGDSPIDLPELIQIASQQPTPRNAEILQQLLQLQQQKQLKDESLIQWLTALQKLRS